MINSICGIHYGEKMLCDRLQKCCKKSPISTPKTVKLYTFPRDPEERRVWLRVLPNKVCPYKAEKENISVCSLHFPENVRFNDKEGKHRRPIDPPSVFDIKETSCIGTPPPKPRPTKKAHRATRNPAPHPDAELHELQRREKLSASDFAARLMALLTAFTTCVVVWTSDKTFSILSKAKEGPIFDFAIHFSIHGESIYTLQYEAYIGLKRFFGETPLDRHKVTQWMQLEILLRNVVNPISKDPTAEEEKQTRRFDFIRRQIALLNTPKNLLTYINTDLLLALSWYTTSRTAAAKQARLLKIKRRTAGAYKQGFRKVPDSPRHAGETSFRNIWKKYCGNIIITKPRTDLC